MNNENFSIGSGAVFTIKGLSVEHADGGQPCGRRGEGMATGHVDGVGHMQ